MSGFQENSRRDVANAKAVLGIDLAQKWSAPSEPMSYLESQAYADHYNQMVAEQTFWQSLGKFRVR